MSSDGLGILAPFQLKPIAFVPARNSDAVPLPRGHNLVVLNAEQPVWSATVRAHLVAASRSWSL